MSRYLEKIFLGCLFFLLLLFLSSQAYAVSVSISNPPSSIGPDPFTLTASISGATNGTNYLRVDIYKEGTTNYFGETFNGSDWYGLSDYHFYLPVTIASNSWIGQIQGRMASPTTGQYDGSGTYRIRLRRYTSSGGYTASEADNSSFVVSIILPTPTPTPTTPPIPTATPYPTATPTPSPSRSPTLLTPKISSVLGQSVSPSVIASIAAASTSSAEDVAKDSPAPDKLVAGIHDSRFPLVPLILLSLGIFLLFGCGILIVRKIKHHESTDTED